MTKTILYECFNLGLPQGTGIKTYVVSLAKAARNLGYSVEALLQSETDLSGEDEPLRAIALAEGAARLGWKERYVTAPLEYLIGKPFGLAASTVAGPDSLNAPFGDDDNSCQRLFEKVLCVSRLTKAARNHFNRYGRLASLNVRSPPDIFHATHPIPIRATRAINVYTIHDVIPLKLPNAFLGSKKYFVKVLREICKTADRIVTVSECSKRDIISITNIQSDRVTVTYQCAALPARLVNRPVQDVENILSNNFGLHYNDYFLYYGALEPKKNVARLIDAHVASGVSTPLVIAGGLGWSYDDVLRKLAQPHFSAYRIVGDLIRPERRIRRFDYLPVSHLTAMIQGARAVLFPSLYEGFGLPVLEAMTIGAPVMTSNVSSLPEVAGDAALLVDPYDTFEMSKAIERLDRDEKLRLELSARGKERAKLFSRENYETKVNDLYSSLP